MNTLSSPLFSPLSSSPLSSPLSYSISSNLGFIGTVADIAALATGISSLASAGFSTYAVVEQVGIAKATAELQRELMERRASLEADLLRTQGKLAEMQTTYYGQREEIALSLDKAKAELLQEQLQRQKLLESLETEKVKAMVETGEAVGAPPTGAVDVERMSTRMKILIGGIGISILGIYMFTRKKE